MSDLTRREALRVAAATSMAAASGTILADDRAAAKAMQREVPVYLKVAKNIDLKLRMPTAERSFKTGAYKPVDFKIAQQMVGDKLEVTVPYQHSHGTLPKLTLTQPDKINYIMMNADKDCKLKVEVLYSDAEMNLNRCCWECDGAFYCALPGFCVQCGPWTYCCPMDSH